MTAPPLDHGPPGELFVELPRVAGASGPLTWGQRAIRRSIVWMGEGDHYFNMGMTVPVPPGLGGHDVAAVLERLVARHEGLRTLFPGWPRGERQVLVGSGRVPLVRVRAEPGTFVDRTQRLAELLRGPRFDHETDLPVRAGVVEVDGDVVRVVLVASHLVVDGTAWEVVRHDLEAMIAQGGTGASLGDAGPSPLEIADLEAGPQGDARHLASIERWRSELGRLTDVSRHALTSAARVAPGASAERFTGILLDAPRASRAAVLVARAVSRTTSVVLFAAIGWTLARRLGLAEVPLLNIVGNRADPQVQGAVVPMAQNGLAVVTPGASLAAGEEGTRAFTDYVRSVGGAVLRSQLGASYDVDRLEADVADPVLDSLGYYFNDSRAAGSWPHLRDRSDAELRAELDSGALARQQVVGAWARLDLTAFFTVSPHPEDLRVLLQVDTARIDPDTAAGMLDDVSDLLERVARSCRSPGSRP
ncbi:condensation domain-containing protein [Cellulosimicrobium marinum]|uniref:condensation domain-containing protein n=1 Tax=Cellulosimicrobium marinum TaxID=1638992 RepID=UPI001E50FEA0|nr:condensation domain-containing protein [Cellulosimicrobium marinum]MCB7135707.1 condensation domain-containing protein [Cellulosimicrobium marinum]